MKTTITLDQINARLAQLTPSNLIGEHTMGGDGKLPKELRGSSMELDRLPTADEVM